MTWLDFLGPILGGAVGSLFGLIGGWLRERETSRRYRMQLAAEQDRLRLLAEAPENARDEIERFTISRPPSVGPLAVLVGLSLTAGVTGGTVAPKALSSLRGGPTDKSCDPPCPPSQRCEGGTCTARILCAAAGLARAPPPVAALHSAVCTLHRIRPAQPHARPFLGNRLMPTVH